MTFVYGWKSTHRGTIRNLRKSGISFRLAEQKFYHTLYVNERRAAGQEYADMVTALKSWRLECPHITVARSTSNFLVCGVCSYLRMQIDMCPRSDRILLDALTERLGQHFAFQSAQRL